MKYSLFPLLLGGLMITVLSNCNKNNSSVLISQTHPFEASLITKWELVKDSTYSVIGAGSVKVQVYMGEAADYWDFRTDAKVYIKEGEKLDTLGYQLLSDSTIVINTFGWIINGASTTSKILTLTPFSSVIRSADLLLPGGIYSRTLYLKM